MESTATDIAAYFNRYTASEIPTNSLNLNRQQYLTNHQPTENGLKCQKYFQIFNVFLNVCNWEDLIPWCTTGGDLSVEQTTDGQLADFNMWDYEMSADEVNVTTCGPAGNVVSWDSLKKKGESMESVKAFPGCNGRFVCSPKVGVHFED